MAKAKPATNSAQKPKRKTKPQLELDGNATNEPMVMQNQEYTPAADQTAPSEPKPATEAQHVKGAKEWRATATTIPDDWKKKLAPKETNEANSDQTEGAPGPAGTDTQADSQPDKLTTTIASQGSAEGQGGVSITSAEPEPLEPVLTRETAKQDAHRRWRNEGRAELVAAFRDRMRMEYVAAHPKCKRRDAHEHAWDRAMAEFPPAGVEPKTSGPEKVSPIGDKTDAPAPPIAPTYSPIADQGVSGLSDIPLDWPDLPANASLQVEIAWVSANRLRVRSGTGVDLSRSLSPAPSYSALSWLETSILFPSKFADISVKATAQQDDEKEYIRREKASIEEIRGILKEMLDANLSPIGDKT